MSTTELIWVGAAIAWVAAVAVWVAVISVREKRRQRAEEKLKPLAADGITDDTEALQQRMDLHCGRAR